MQCDAKIEAGDEYDRELQAFGFMYSHDADGFRRLWHLKGQLVFVLLYEIDKRQ